MTLGVSFVAPEDAVSRFLHDLRLKSLISLLPHGTGLPALLYATGTGLKDRQCMPPSVSVKPGQTAAMHQDEAILDALACHCG